LKFLLNVNIPLVLLLLIFESRYDFLFVAFLPFLASGHD